MTLDVLAAEIELAGATDRMGRDVGETVPYATTPDALSLAARQGSSLSPESRARLAELLREMRQDSQNP